MTSSTLKVDNIGKENAASRVKKVSRQADKRRKKANDDVWLSKLIT